MNTTDTPIETSSGNVYEDLGMVDGAEMLVKTKLASKIADIIKRKNLTLQKPAELLAMSQPKVSMMLRGQFRGASANPKCSTAWHAWAATLTSSSNPSAVVPKRIKQSQQDG